MAINRVETGHLILANVNGKSLLKDIVHHKSIIFWKGMNNNL